MFKIRNRKKSTDDWMPRMAKVNPSESQNGPKNPINVKAGQELRHIRREKQLSLKDVEVLSNMEFKASVVGAYERGERAITFARLEELLNFYNFSLGAFVIRYSLRSN